MNISYYSTFNSNFNIYKIDIENINKIDTKKNDKNQIDCSFHSINKCSN